MTTLTAPPAATLVSRFAGEFNAVHLREHGVASPLGLWLLLALIAPASTGTDRDRLEAVLGTHANAAAQRAAELLDGAHPAVRSAVAVWANALAVGTDGFAAWAASLPTGAQKGPIPSQGDADRWAATHTLDLITKFPLSLTPDTALVLASALATKVTWTAPFDDATPSDLGGAFGDHATTALHSPSAGPHRQFLAHTQAAGIVGVLVARSADGLVVTSVIAAPTVPARDVHRAALEVDAYLHAGPRAGSGATELSLFDLPLGDGHAWHIDEVVEQRTGGTARSEIVDAFLPAWSLKSQHDLSTSPGVQAAFNTLETFLAPELRPASFEATQSAVAAFRKDGFEAAAVTAMAMRCAAMPTQVETRERSATIRFNRPFAVVASASNRARNTERRRGTIYLGVPAWDGVPVFSAWIGQVA